MFNLIPGWVALFGIGGLIASVFTFIYLYDERGNEIERLNEQVARLKQTAVVCEANIQTANETAKTLAERLKERQGSLEQLCRLYNDNKLDLPAAPPAPAPSIPNTVPFAPNVDKSGPDSPVGEPIESLLEGLKELEK